MDGKQLQAARVLLGWSQSKAALAAGLSVPTVKRAEGTGKTKASDSAISALQTALELAGVEFISENGGGAGVRLKRKD